MKTRGSGPWRLWAAAVLFTLFGTGCKNYLVFSTATKFGFDASQRADRTVEVTLGYQRAEVVSIPACPDDKEPGVQRNCFSDDTSDTYTVLGTFHVDLGNPFTMEPIEIQQVFATGMAAQNASNNPGLAKLFYDATTKVAEEATEGR